MPLVSSREILRQAREKKYGVPSEGSFTDPDQAADFVHRTGVDTLAISFGNAHGVYKGEPNLDLNRVRKIHACLPSLDLPSH